MDEVTVAVVMDTNSISICVYKMKCAFNKPRTLPDFIFSFCAFLDFKTA